MQVIPFIDAQDLNQSLPFAPLITGLKEAFQENYHIPQRHHHDYANPKENIDSTLLLMPAWQAGKYLGVKMVTISPNNGKYNLPSIQGIYSLMDAHKGMPLAHLEAKTLTVRRTAATSALASSFLSRLESESLLMVGTGALAPALIKAHATVRPIQNVYIWGRNFEKAQQIANSLSGELFSIKAIKNIADKIGEVDIISCATLSETPLIFGNALSKGQHIDLVGSYKPNMREADDNVIRRATLFVDVFAGATKETGDIVIPLNEGLITIEDIKADLFGLCRKEVAGRQDATEITCFKSVGYALEDLVAAKMAYEALF